MRRRAPDPGAPGLSDPLLRVAVAAGLLAWLGFLVWWLLGREPWRHLWSG